jgi:hypothetical protein
MLAGTEVMNHCCKASRHHYAPRMPALAIGDSVAMYESTVDDWAHAVVAASKAKRVEVLSIVENRLGERGRLGFPSAEREQLFIHKA